MRKPCKECPWERGLHQDKRFVASVGKMEKKGRAENHLHACHMVTKDIWCLDEPLTVGNVCMGALHSNKKSLKKTPK